MAILFSTITDKTYVHDQTSPSSTWTIDHNMGKYPSVAIVDSGKTVVYGNIQYININSLVITFSLPFGGWAYLN